MTNVTTYDRPTVESAAAMKAPDMSYLGTSGAHFDQFGADDTFGGLDYNAPPPDAYGKHQGIQIENTFGSETQTGKEYRKRHEITVKAPRGVEVPDPMQDFDDGKGMIIRMSFIGSSEAAKKIRRRFRLFLLLLLLLLFDVIRRRGKKMCLTFYI